MIPFDNLTENEGLQHGSYAGLSFNYTSPQNDEVLRTIVNSRSGVVQTGASAYLFTFDGLSLRKAEALQNWSETVL